MSDGMFHFEMVIVLVDPKRFGPIIVWVAWDRLFGW